MRDTMAKYRKKPIVIEAMQYTGSNLSEVLDFINAHSKTNRSHYIGGEGRLCVKTPEGNMRASFDDWVIIGIGGEVYPCKPDIFKATYEEVL